jgi:hypothetical protein
MKLSDAREHYYTFSGKASDVSRKLCFAGLAVVWLFVITESNGVYVLKADFFWALLAFVGSLSFDLLHSVYAAFAWGIYHRTKELELRDEEKEFKAPAAINNPALFFFTGKLFLSVGGYLLLVIAIVS